MGKEGKFGKDAPYSDELKAQQALAQTEQKLREPPLRYEATRRFKEELKKQLDMFKTGVEEWRKLGNDLSGQTGIEVSFKIIQLQSEINTMEEKINSILEEIEHETVCRQTERACALHKRYEDIKRLRD